MKNKNIIYGFLILTLSVFMGSCTNAVDYDLNKNFGDMTILIEEFDKGTLGSFTVQQVHGEQSWYGESRGYAMITGYVEGSDHANESWLISPKIDLTNVESAHFSFEHVARYFANLQDEATLWISTDYQDGLPETANWEQIYPQIPFINSNDWNFLKSGDISLTQYVGSEINIAFKYISTDSKAGSWEVKNFVVSSGEANELSMELGKGTSDNPYTVSGAILNAGQSDKWITGYIVGYMGNGVKPSYEVDDRTVKTNIMIADELNSSYLSQVLVVQLPTGVLRNALNLKDNPNNLGKKIKLYGNIANNANVGYNSISSFSYFELENGTVGGDYPFNPIYEESLMTQSSFDKFTIFDVKGAQSWRFDGQYGAVISGFADNRSYANEDWFISPALDLSSYEKIYLSFDHARGPAGSINVGVDEGYYTVWVSNDYNEGDPNDVSWTELTGVVHGTKAWEYVSSGNLAIPNDNLKANFRFAFRYLCDNQESATWEVKNVALK